MNKRGISPLIATVLIVGFTIVLAVLVIAWLSGVFQTKLSTEDCNIKGQEYCANLNNLLDVSTAETATDTVVTVAFLGTAEPAVKVSFLDASGVTKGVEDVTWNADGTIGTATLLGDINIVKVQAFVSYTPTDVPGVACSEIACAPVTANVA